MDFANSSLPNAASHCIMKSDGSIVMDKKMSSKKKKSSAKSKPEDPVNFSNGRSGSSRSNSNDADTGGFHPANMIETSNSVGNRNMGRFPLDMSNDGYMGKPISHMNNYNSRFPGRLSYARNEMENGMMNPLRNDQYPMYDQSKYGFPNSSSRGHHSEQFFPPQRPGYSSMHPVPMLPHGYPVPGNAQPGFGSTGQLPNPSPTPMLTQLLQYPNQREKPQGPPYDDNGRPPSGPPKGWQPETPVGTNQNLHQRLPTPGEGYEEQQIHSMNQTYSNQVWILLGFLLFFKI